MILPHRVGRDAEDGTYDEPDEDQRVKRKALGVRRAIHFLRSPTRGYTLDEHFGEARHIAPQILFTPLQPKARPFGLKVSTRPFGLKVSIRPFGLKVSTRPFGLKVSTRPFGLKVSTRPFGLKVRARFR